MSRAPPNRIRARPVCESYGMLWALLRQYVRPYRWLLAVVAVLQLVSTLASLYLPTINAAIIDDGVAKGDTERHRRAGRHHARGHRAAGAVRGRRRLLRLAGRHGVRPRPALGDLPPRDGIVGRGDRPVRRRRRCSPAPPTTSSRSSCWSQMTCTMLITAPIMSVGGIVMAIHQNAGLSWLLVVSVPVLGLANYWIVVAPAAAVPQHAAPDRRHQSRDCANSCRASG